MTNTPGTLGCCIMVKNEAERILRTIKTVEKYITHLIILDTGSTDGTQTRIKRRADKNKDKYELFLFEEPFADFSTSRNKLLEYASTVPCSYLLLLDANEEVQNLGVLPPLTNEHYLLPFKIDNDEMGTVEFQRVALIKNDGKSRYKYPVHEWLTYDGKEIEVDFSVVTSGVSIYQDRNKDKPSTPRFQEDLIIIRNYIAENGFDLRMCHHLKQTLFITMNEQNRAEHWEEIVKISEDMIRHGLEVEATTGKQAFIYTIYQAYASWADYLLYKEKDNEKEITLRLLKCYEYSKRTNDGKGDCVPLFSLAGYHFSHRKNIPEAFAYCKKCCSIQEPNVYQIIRSPHWEHRWGLMSAIGKEMTKAKVGFFMKPFITGDETESKDEMAPSENVNKIMKDLDKLGPCRFDELFKSVNK